ncbi:PH domain-containing protein [Micromonosporaceae bacterium DT194]|uniref:PH domain-containing protein n=1 Tax=Melissospora conviva TaxID=3388432 RepID=UPI003C1BDC15
MSESQVVRLQPRRIRLICWPLAAALLIGSVLISTTLEGFTGGGRGQYQRGDQLAMIGVGIFLALGVLVFTRPRIEADIRGLKVRNVFSSYELPWEVVRRVRFDRGTPWASLELYDDNLMSLVALQAADKELAVEGVRALRRLHEARHAELATATQD